MFCLKKKTNKKKRIKKHFKYSKSPMKFFIIYLFYLQKIKMQRDGNFFFKSQIIKLKNNLLKI